MTEFICSSVQQTQQVAADIATTLKGGEVLCLFGDLGTGKTTFVKGLARALGIKEAITSPTFTLMNLYAVGHRKSDIRYPISDIRLLIHIDTYRLEREQELGDIGAADYIGQTGTVTVVEWPEKLEKLLQGKRIIKIMFEHWEEGKRKIVVE